MNRYEVIGMFTAMEALYDTKQYEKLGEVIKKTLAAAEGKSFKSDSNKDDEIQATD
ncbi:MAG: hypothetical protein FWF94_00610 [Oscillospiraceae bacterium]|nr:hypothetical protein [Oscillospiraceae bacterium]